VKEEKKPEYYPLRPYNLSGIQTKDPVLGDAEITHTTAIGTI